MGFPEENWQLAYTQSRLVRRKQIVSQLTLRTGLYNNTQAGGVGFIGKELKICDKITNVTPPGCVSHKINKSTMLHKYHHWVFFFFIETLHHYTVCNRSKNQTQIILNSTN